LFPLIPVDYSISTQRIDHMTSSIANIQQRAIQLAIVAFFRIVGMRIDDAISARLV
jgi:hypothetical protein